MSTRAPLPKLGVRLPVTGKMATPANISLVARWAEELAFNSVWGNDHILPSVTVRSRYPGTGDGYWPFPSGTRWLEPLTTLSLVAALAPKLQVGTCVLVLPLRNPIVVAKQAATLAFLSGGRLTLGIGVGWQEEEFRSLSSPFDERGARATEAVRLMRTLWSGQICSFAGEYWQVEESEMHPAPPGRIPILWGGMSRAAISRVARLGDGWLPTYRTVEDLRRGREALLIECERVGREPDSVRIVFKPGPSYRLDRTALEELKSLGVTEFISDPPMSAPGLIDCRDELERLAVVADLSGC